MGKVVVEAIVVGAVVVDVACTVVNTGQILILSKCLYSSFLYYLKA